MTTPDVDTDLDDTTAAIGEIVDPATAAAPGTSDADAADAATTDSKVSVALAWPDAPADGWNAGVRVLRGLNRYPVSGLTSVGAARAMSPLAEEAADGRAIAYVPIGFDATAPIEVLVHLHGFGIGWRQHTAVAGTPPDDLQTRYVNDVRDYALADQVADAGRSMIVLLPQGDMKSSFAPAGAKFDCDTFVAEALAALASGSALAQQPVVAMTILGGHSGGGGAIVGIEIESGSPRLPRTLSALFLFDAVNGFHGQASREAIVHATFVTSRLAIDLARIVAAASDDDRLAAANASFRFYGTYSQSDYAFWYGPLKDAIDRWFVAHAAALGGTASAMYAALRANYVVTSVSGVPHPEMVGHGNLLHALATLA